MTKFLSYHQTPLGELSIVAGNDHLIQLGLVGDELPSNSVLCDLSTEPEIITHTKRQLDEYFAGKRSSFDLPLAPRGTDFQQQVWAALCAIPYGQTQSYGQIAAYVGRPKAARAVGGANNKNPIAIIIPCHRVIGASGAMVGYRGGLDIKHQLLELEGIIGNDY